MSIIKIWFHHFFRDKNGRIVAWQYPNLPLFGWIIFKLFEFVVTGGNVKHAFAQLSAAFLFVWAFLEVTKGVSNFRKTLGLVVLAGIVTSYF